MLRYLMESCVLFDYTVIYLFQGYYLILNCKKVPSNRKEKKNNNQGEHVHHQKQAAMFPGTAGLQGVKQVEKKNYKLSRLVPGTFS